MEFNQDFLKIILICDDSDTGYTWFSLLRNKGMNVSQANSHYSFSKINGEESPDLIIIDSSDTKMNAIELIKEIKSNLGCPILYLSAQSSEPYVVQAYQAGVDECVTKPISPMLFLYRVRALLRRSRTIPVTGLEKIGSPNLLLDPSRRTIQINAGKEIRLSQLEFRLLHLLMSHPGRVFQPEQVIHAVWGYSEAGDNRLVKHLVFRLRQKIEIDHKKPKYIKTESGVGYKFEFEDV